MRRDIEPTRVLIFRPASLGDTIVSLPCFHLLARRFPFAERRVLSQVPRFATSVSLHSILIDAGLIHGFFAVDYERMQRSIAAQWVVIRQIRRWKPDLLVHLTEPSNVSRLLVERLFFRFCGIRRVVGLPLRRDLRQYQFDPAAGRYEYEAARLARCLADLGDARLDDPGSWNLRLSDAERSRARVALGPAAATRRLLACSVGATIDTKDWGAANWLTLVRRLAPECRDYGLAMVGSAVEFNGAEAIRDEWMAPSVNLCGMLSVRESAAVIELASFYLGHDSGPMHLAAAAGIPCVAVFSARRKAGIWFPYGNQHKVIFHDVPCRDCILVRCERYSKRCISSITVDEVLNAVRQIVNRPGQHNGTATRSCL